RMLESIPAYQDGKGWLNKAWGAVKSGAGKVKDAAVNVWDYMNNPSKLLDLALKTLGVKIPKGGSFVGNIAKAGVSKIKDAAVDFIKDEIEDFINSIPSGGVKKWAGVAARALMMTGQFSPENLSALLYQMQTESGGNPRAINLWDSNAKRG